LKNVQFCSRSRKAKILTTGIYSIFRGLQFEHDAKDWADKRRLRKGVFCKGLEMGMRLSFVSWISLLLCIFLHSTAFGEKRKEVTNSSSSLISSLRKAVPRDFCGEPVPWENSEVRERFEKEFLLSLGNSPQVILWIKRSKRYLPYIEKMLKQNGLPADLKYVAVAESALRPHAGSKKGAMGFWQFMKSTGRSYGLTIDRNKDERRNLFRSTGAAIRYFKDLHEEFGSWTLAAAGYNMGERGLMAEILEQKTEDYYELYLPSETQRFLFRILSIKMILLNPEKFGFYLGKEDYYSPFVFDRVRIKAVDEVPLRIIAQAAECHFKEIKDLNPEIRGHYLNAGTHEIYVPKDKAEGFQERYALLLKNVASEKNERIYVVETGDSLSSISSRFNVPLAALVIWNRINIKSPIHPGQRLIISPGDH